MKLVFLRIFLLFLAVFCLCLSPAALASVRVAVIYPQVDQPYAKVFENIIGNIQQQKDLEVKTYSLREHYDSEAVKHWVTQQKAQTLVVLGQRGVDAVEKLDIDIPIIIGAVLYISGVQNEVVSGISLTPDPDLLFKHLKQMAPDIKRVHVVYNPDRYQWLIDYAKTVAKNIM